MSETAPSTDWQETVHDWEEEWHEQVTKDLIAIQTRYNSKFGPGRALHRRQVVGLQGKLTVNADLPPHLNQGVFVAGAQYECLLRLSDASWTVHSDASPDIHGIGLSLRGVSGPGALGFETDRQDFLFTERSVFGFATSREFGALVKAASQGQAALGKFFIATYGPIKGPLMAAKMATESKPFLGFATSTFNTLVALQVGPYAARVQLAPRQRRRNVKAIVNYTDDIKKRLRKADLVYDVNLQFFVDEKTTPIEDGSVEWSEKISPYVPVAVLTIPVQNCDSPSGQELSTQIEADHFDPWSALVEHKPLGEIMRARKATYFSSVTNRSK